MHRDETIKRLPLVTLYLSERCNSRCITCDYWRHGRTDLDLERVRALLPSFERLGTETILISGGEPLLNLQWAEIAQLLRARGLKLWLLTSGLSLAKHAHRAATLFDTITVSLDGTRPETYAAIRGLDAFDNVCAGIRAAAAAGAQVSVRVTLQRANYRELLGFVALARASGAQQVSFLAVDVANAHAFARAEASSLDLALRTDELNEFEHLVGEMEQVYAAEFRSGFIAESPSKMRRVLQYFRAVNGLGAFPGVRCNAPEFSAVVGADGSVKPCFFIPGPMNAIVKTDLEAVLNARPSTSLRAEIRAGKRPECARCVCSVWRELPTSYDLSLSHLRHA